MPQGMHTADEKLVDLLVPKQPVELRRAAALVVGEVGSNSKNLATRLLDGLCDEDREVRLNSINAISKLRIEQALPKLIERLEQGGEEAEPSAYAAAGLGAKGVRALQNRMPQVAPGLRRYIAGALAAVGASKGQAGGKTAVVAMLLDSDPGVVEAAVRSISAEIPALSRAKRETLVDELIDLVKRQKKAQLPVASELAVTRLFAALVHPRSESLIWERTKPSYATQVRAAALAALGQVVKSPSKEQISQLFLYAAEEDVRIASPALLVLKALPADSRSTIRWTELLGAPDPSVRQLALEKIGNRTNDHVLEGMLGALRHSDRSFQGAVVSCLSRTSGGQKTLGEALVTAGSADEAWVLARAQTSFAKEHGSKFRQRLFKQVGLYLEANDRRADAILFLLRAIDPVALGKWLETRGMGYRKKKAYASALPYLQCLARDPACGLSSRLELAACELKLSTHELTAEGRSADATTRHFAQLWQRFGPDLVREMARMKWLNADDLYYLGFHFSENEGPVKKLGGEFLKLVVSRSPRSKTARAAKSKLSREGLE